MSSIPKQLATFAAVLAVLYAAGFAVGQVIDTSHGKDDMEMGHKDEPVHGGGESHGAPADVVRGLAVAAGGLTLDLRTPELRRDSASELRFAVTGDDGRPVRDFEVTHERRMHLIVVRRDLTGFQHLHPRMAADGTWSVPVRLEEAGSYRVFADFERGGTPRTLASDLRVDGRADLEALPPASDAARTGDGYEVRLDAGAVRAGRESELAFRITRGGRPVETEPYLGAGGHLVALREGDLAFLHVHPLDEGAARFAATFPTAGRYRLFLQFKAAGRVHTAAFTQDVAAG